MPGWDRLTAIVSEEFTQAIEEGKDREAVEALRPAFDAAEDREAELHAVLEQLMALPVTLPNGAAEPDSWEEIVALRPVAGAPLPSCNADSETLLDRIHGAWLGRCAGCALGKPFEMIGLRGVQDGGMQPWLRIKRYLTAISPEEWPIRDYIPEHSPAETDPAVGKVSCRASTREHIAFMETDDDIRYTVLGLVLLSGKGVGFTSWDVASNWIARLPYQSVCTAETQAYHNLVSRYEFHYGAKPGESEKIDWNWVSTYRNPFREWIGAQIRIDAFGYAAAGNPALAAEMAWRDARISHSKNGIYGAMFCAAMIAAAFATEDSERIVQAGLEQIPADCRLSRAIHDTIRIVEAHDSDPERIEDIFRQVHAAFESYHVVHTIPNAAICVVAILLARGDFHKGITFAVMGGWDTDCNGATVGSVVGAITGAKAAPSHWTGRLNDTLRSGIIDYDPIAISECARQTFQVYQDSNE